MPNFSILLAPAEGKKPGGNPLAPDMFDYRSSNTFNYFHELNSERRNLIDQLGKVIKKAPKTELSKIIGVTGKNLDEAVAVNTSIYGGPLMAALDRYSPGVMYEAMSFTSLPTGAQRRLLENGIIFSGMYGLLRPDDMIPNYKLKMDAKLPKIGKVSHYWRPHISPLLNKTLKDRVVWNLLPGAHQEAWEDDHCYREMILVKFVKKEGQRFKSVTHGVKTLRGQLTNFIVQEAVEDLELFGEWKHPGGYRYDESRTIYDDEKKTRTITMLKK